MTVLLMNTNYVDSDTLTSATASSADTSFPVTNLYNSFRRSKVWRSAGQWEITSSNNVIIFRETAAVDLTATIAIADYSTTATFLAAIKTALEAAGGSVYTVTQDSTSKKINIASDGAGGGGLLELMWTDVLSIAAATLGYSTGADDTGGLTYTADDLKIHTSESIVFDFGVASNPYAFALVGPRNDPLGISSSATFKLQGNETDAWTSPSYDQTLTVYDDVISVFKASADAGLHTSALRYWRIYIEDVSNSNNYVEFGSVFLGQYFEPVRGRVQFPFTSSFVDFSKNTTTISGSKIGEKRNQTEKFNLKWFGLTIADKETLDDHFADVGEANPFFISLDPNAEFSSDARLYVRNVKYSSPPSYSLPSPGVFSYTMPLEEEI